MTPPWPLVDACCPKRVGPKTMERFCIDIEFSAECWFMLEKSKLKHILPKDTDRGDSTDAGDP
jgi:hypothetical protein